MTETRGIAAIVAAAGQSTRMGRPKQLLPWGDSTVIKTTVSNLTQAGVSSVVVVSGHEAGAVEAALAGTEAQVVHNSEYASNEMLYSFKFGLRRLMADSVVGGTLLCLGDQPHIPVGALRSIVQEAVRSPACIQIPSHNRRRGHPIYVPVSLWNDVLAIDGKGTLRTLLESYQHLINYVVVESPAILHDMDTLADYEALRPR